MKARACSSFAGSKRVRCAALRVLHSVTPGGACSRSHLLHSAPCLPGHHFGCHTAITRHRFRNPFLVRQSVPPEQIMCDVSCLPDGEVLEVTVTCPGDVHPVGTLKCVFKGGYSARAYYNAENGVVTAYLKKNYSSLTSEVKVVIDKGNVVVTSCGSCTAVVREVPANSLDQSVLAAIEEDELQNQSPTAVLNKLSFLDRYLAVWIFLAMLTGVLLGVYVDDVQRVFDTAKIDKVSAPIAVGLWVMMYPVLVKVRYEVIPKFFKQREMVQQLGISFVVNWIIGPFLMTGLAWACLPDLDRFRAGVILVGLARCIAMVLIWNMLAGGQPEYCAILVAFNSVLQIVLYAPFAIFHLQVISHMYTDPGALHISFWDVARSVLIFLGGPLAAGFITRYLVWAVMGKKWLEEKFIPFIGPWALMALLYTIVVLFALQGKHIVGELGNVARVAVPLTIYFIIMWFSTFIGCRRINPSYELAVTQSFTASSNNFELAIAVAIGTFGANSKEALAATVGPLIEVPVLLALVYVALALKKQWLWGEALLGGKRPQPFNGELVPVSPKRGIAPEP